MGRQSVTHRRAHPLIGRLPIEAARYWMRFWIRSKTEPTAPSWLGRLGLAEAFRLLQSL